MKNSIFGIVILFISLNIFTLKIAFSQSQIDLRQPLTPENYKIWDEYIKKYAPADSAFKVMVNIANRHHLRKRYAVSWKIYSIYEKFFPNRKSAFKQKIENYGKWMLTVAPTPDQDYIYEEYALKLAPSENAFVAVQRLAEKHINEKNWDSVAIILNYFKPRFPNMSERFDAILQIVAAKSENLVARNISDSINTKYNEWDPTPTFNGNALFFSTRRPKETFGGSDVWVSFLKDGVWLAPKPVNSNINGPNDETVDNVSPDGSGLLFSGAFPGTFGKFDIYYSSLSKDGWGTLKHYPMPVNSEHTDEGGNLSPDGKALLFTSDRPGGIGPSIPYGTPYRGGFNGNMDIYISFKTGEGWSEPTNLGETVNTPFAERSPFLHPDGKTLYFSSDGHPGLGGLDVFKTVRLREDSWTHWSEPVNLGKDVNSAQDDWGYVVSLSGDSAFFAVKDRPGGKGEWDIYSIPTPGKAKPERVVAVSGIVTDAAGNPLSAAIKWEDLSTGENVGELRSNPQTGEYFIALPFGKNYGYYAEKEGYYPTSKNIDLRGDTILFHVREDIVLHSTEEIAESEADVKIQINNIFFDYDKYDLKPESFLELNRLADFLQNNDNLDAIIVGHTDSIGSRAYNKNLSNLRAKAVEDYLIGKGCDAGKLSSKGMGADQPVAGNESEEGRAKNRRVEIWFVKSGK